MTASAPADAGPAILRVIDTPAAGAVPLAGGSPRIGRARSTICGNLPSLRRTPVGFRQRPLGSPRLSTASHDHHIARRKGKESVSQRVLNRPMSARSPATLRRVTQRGMRPFCSTKPRGRARAFCADWLTLFKRGLYQLYSVLSPCFLGKATRTKKRNDGLSLHL